MTKTAKRAEWNTPLGSLWHFTDRVTTQPCIVRVSGKFKTEDGWYASLRDAKTDVGQGNCPMSALGARVTR